MLTKLVINNIALIEKNSLEFENGLNILTGETGAGKSLVIDSLNFVLGARADKTLIKNGEDFAKVEAVFCLQKPSAEINNFFYSINLEPENTILITRYLSMSGKNEVRVNGELVTNTMLKKLTSLLVDIHGQHSHQSLLETKNHIYLLDEFDATTTNNLKQKLIDQITLLNDIKSKINNIGGIGVDRERNIDLLNYQINEIQNANLKNNEEQELVDRKTLMLNSEKIHSALSLTNSLLSDSDYNALALIKNAINNLNTVSGFDDELVKQLDKLQSQYYELLDVAENLSDKMSELNFSEQELNDIEERLDTIKNLKRKYGATFEDIFSFLFQAKEKLNVLQNADYELNKLLNEKTKVLKSIYDTCTLLTTARHNIAATIESQIETELKDLGMKNAKFKVEFTNNYSLQNIEQRFTINGADELEFMFSANLGEPVKPLSKIISGGEMSRFMLAIKCVINDNSNKTLIFDEIDNGIGGNVGHIVAVKLSKLSRANQIICVTHLAQIASFADTHFKIEKIENDNKTITKTTQLNQETKVVEIARLLGSDNSTKTGWVYATEMLDNAHKLKQ